jgi:hypothetical protein
LFPSRHTPKSRGNRKTQTTRLARQKGESVMLVETLRRLVPGVNQHRKHAEFSARRARQRIRQENATESLPW